MHSSISAQSATPEARQEVTPEAFRTLTPEGNVLPESGLDLSIREAVEGLLQNQREDGHWAYELEADATISAEYILLNHYLGEIDDVTEARLANYLRGIQEEHGGWPLFYGGDLDISASVKAYYALKMVGDSVNAPHMKRARELILANGGAAKSNIFTRFMLALFGQVPWRAVPVIRVETLLLPKWSPFHIDKVSYWSRTVMVPLMVLAVLKPRARNPRNIGVEELFVTLPENHRRYLNNPTGHWLGTVMLGLDKVARVFEPFMPEFFKKKAIDKAKIFVSERLNGEDGLGGIFPAMANTLMMFDALDYGRDHPDYVIARKALSKLLVLKDDSGYCQPCLSPVWDTGLAIHAMLESGQAPDGPSMSTAMDWLRDRQILNIDGDWKVKNNELRPGGWAFQYWNDHYPDVDDTAVVVMALHRADPEKYDEAIKRGVEWTLGMQSKNGGWGAFDIDNNYSFLNHIPFADHGALLDPPTADVSARCISMLAQVDFDRSHPSFVRAVAYLKNEQEEDGSWFGRWGTNYIYGTWSALCALNAAGEDMNAPYIRRAVDWLIRRQQADGGWGEDCATYFPGRFDEVKKSTPSQTSWAVLGLIAAGEVDSDVVAGGVQFLIDASKENGKWEETYFNAVGFPRIFYLNYHGYSAYFPLWALARYRELRGNNARKPVYGM